MIFPYWGGLNVLCWSYLTFNLMTINLHFGELRVILERFTRNLLIKAFSLKSTGWPATIITLRIDTYLPFKAKWFRSPDSEHFLTRVGTLPATSVVFDQLSCRM